MDDTAHVSDVITRMLHAIDALDWDAVGEAFADSVDVDYTSLAGGEPATLPAAQLFSNWRALLPGFEATQHLTGPVVVREGARGVLAETHVRGYHRIAGAPGGELWMVAGHYTFGMVREHAAWKIRAIRLTVFYQEGNLKLPEIAQVRARQSPRK